MQVSELCGDFVAVVLRSSPVQEAAQLMRQYHIGAVVVVDVSDSVQIPVGIVTDRDIVVGVVAMNVDPQKLSVGDIMTEDLSVVAAECDVFEAIAEMRRQGVRRMPVVNSDGVLRGIISLDDLLPVVAQELADLAKLPSVGRKRERVSRR
jgi:signal-transduction protein with cAMP-binding, CBS, and nucleotidyltransferase domain